MPYKREALSKFRMAELRGNRMNLTIAPTGHDDQPFMVRVEASATINDVKAKIQEVKGWSLELFWLEDLRGRTLEGGNTLSDYNIRKRQVLNLGRWRTAPSTPRAWLGDGVLKNVCAHMTVAACCLLLLLAVSAAASGCYFAVCWLLLPSASSLPSQKPI